MNEQQVSKLKNISSRLTNIREQISLVMDTCCFATIDIEYDEFEEMVREIDTIISELSNP